MTKSIHTYVVLAYKESSYLEECIKSVLNQKYKSNVVIATATPNPFIEKMAKKYKLDIFVNDGKKGIGADFDFAIKVGRTELVTVAHQDDIYNYEYSYNMVNEYKKNKDAIIIFSDYYEIKDNKEVNSNINLFIKRVLLLPLRFKKLSHKRGIKRSALRFGDAICCPSVTFNKSKVVFPVFDSEFKCDVDWNAWEKLSLLKGKFIYNKQHLMGHRVHEESTTTEIIKEKIRTKEDLIILKRFWPTFIASFINKFYSQSEKNNDLKKKDIEINKNNFKIIKLIAAFLVIVSHAFSITQGSKIVDPLYELTNHSISFGSLAVSIFMLLSGFFIAKSINSNGSFKNFFSKRILKIFPSLIIVILTTAFLIGPLFCQIELSEYFTNSSTYLYVIKNIFLVTTHTISGLFEGNIYNLSINGALWTLPIEFLCYIGCFVAYKLKIMDPKYLKYTIFPAILLIIFSSRIYEIIPILGVVLPLVLMFYIGIVGYTYFKRINLKISILLVFLLIGFVLINLNMYNFLIYLVVPYLIFFLGYFKKIKIYIFNYLGNFTYEIYLLGFIIQQTICYIFGGKMDVYLNMSLSIIFVIPLAIIVNEISKKMTNKIISK